MSKRHRKTKDFLNSEAFEMSDAFHDPAKGRKLKGRDRRRMQKPAFYDT